MKAVSTISGTTTSLKRSTKSDFSVQITEEFLSSLDLLEYASLNNEQKEEYLRGFDALQLLVALNGVNEKLGALKLENHILNDFLFKNDPKLLEGLERRLLLAKKRASLQATRRGSRSFSVFASSNIIHAKAVVYKLNLRAKTEMAESLSRQLERCISDIKTKATLKIRKIYSHLEELRYRTEETKELSKNFHLHFLTYQRDLNFLEMAPLAHICHRLQKFVMIWKKKANTMFSLIRLQMSMVQENCQKQRSELVGKTEKSVVVRPVDFDQLKHKRRELKGSLDMQNHDMSGLKRVKGKVSSAMTKDKKVMMNLDSENKRLKQKIVEATKVIKKIKADEKVLELENIKSLRAQEEIRRKLKRYVAPTADAYIQNNADLSTLERESKILDRKITILHMKLANTRKKNYEYKTDLKNKM